MRIEIKSNGDNATALVTAWPAAYRMASIRITDNDKDTAQIYLDADGFRSMAKACSDAAALIDATIAARKRSDAQ